jgi:hypothetical protein
MGIKKLISPRKSKDGKSLNRADSRPITETTYFTMRGDSATGIGDGEIMTWDFSNSNNIVTDSITTEIPSGYKRKRIILSFVDQIHIKEGTMYWENAPYGCHIDFWVICPSGQYYLDRDVIPHLASEDTPLVHYVNHHRILGTCYMGDELNTESANEDAVPSNYELWVEITTPNTDETSKGHSELEIYRERTHLLPGESV